MNRRGFLGRLVAGGFGLAVGSAVKIEAATAAETELALAPQLLPPLGDRVWITRLDPRSSQDELDVSSWGHPDDRIMGLIKYSLDVRFEGPGCYDLAKVLQSKMGRSFGIGKRRQEVVI